MIKINLNNLEKSKTIFVNKKYKMIINKIMFSTFMVIYIIQDANKIAEFVFDSDNIEQIRNLDKFIRKYKFKIRR